MDELDLFDEDADEAIDPDEVLRLEVLASDDHGENDPGILDN